MAGEKLVKKALDFLRANPELKPYKGGSFSLERQGVYNPKYFDLKKDDLVDEAGNIIASKDVTIPREGFSYDLPAQADPNKIFRGMSAEEFANFQKNNYLQSLGTHNIGEGQKGLTYFSVNPDEARSYAHGFAPSEFKPDPSRPAYVVAAKRPPDESIARVPGTGESEVGVMGQIPREDVTNVYRGNVVDYIEGIHEPGARVSPSSSVHWEEINDYARGGHIDAALHAVRHHLAGGGFLSDLFSGPDYQSTGEVASPTNWGDPDNAADFFRADKALRLAREVQARADDVTGSTPRQAPLTAPRPGPVEERELPVNIPLNAPERGVSLLSSDISPASVTSLPLAYSPEPPKNPARAAIDEATKLTGRAPQGPELSARDRDLIIRTIAAETSGKSPEESQAIAHVILNRIQSGQYGASPEAVLFAPKQFEPWSNRAGANYPMRFTPESRRYGMGQTALDAALGAEDITGGATNFWAPKAQAALGRRPPEWGRTGGVDIGETRFHKLERAHGGLVDDALHVVREHHADGEAVGQAPEMPAEEPRQLTIYRGNAPVADEAGGSGREAVPAFSYMPMPESVERQAARQPAYNPAERTWSDAGSTEGERLTRALGVEGELPKGETFMSPQPTGWDKYMPQRVPGTFLKRTGEAFNENADAVSEGLKAVREGNYGAGALGMVGGALGAAISPLTGMERVLVRDPYLRMTGNLKDAQAAEMAADVALTGGLRGMVKPFAKAGNLEKLAAEPVTSAYRLPSPAATGAATAAGAMLTPEDAEASKLSKAMEVARMAIPRELSPLGFYSHGAEAARGLSQAKGTPQQFASMLNTAGVKGPEMESFLKTFGGRPIVTREEIAKHFQDTMPQIEETVLGKHARPEDVKNYFGLDDKAFDELTPQEFLQMKTTYLNAHGESSPTKFGQYTLPGGENYREVLLKMPNPGDALNARRLEIEKIGAAATPEQRQEWADIMNRLRPDSSDVEGVQKYKNFPEFRSQHWDDPDVLAHLRMADRTGPNGEKILHVEEIQSDWGQKGKKEGFKSPKGLDPDLDVWANSASKLSAGEYDNLIERLRKRYNVADANAENDIYAAAIDQQTSGIPHAPYVTNTQAWTDLALKRALKEAAEGGYDKLVWTPGAEQAKRYDLSNQVRSIDYMKEGDNSYRLGIVDKRGEGIDLPKETFTAKELEDYLGRDVANKIINDEGQSYRGRNHKSLEGVDLVLGGEGMKGYYDKIVPNQLSKLVKKLDPEAKIDRHIIETDKSPRSLAHFLEWSAQNGDTRPRPTLGEVWSRGDADPDVRAFMASKRGVDAPSLTITPKMREAILKGQTAFKDGGSVVDRALMLVSRQA